MKFWYFFFNHRKKLFFCLVVRASSLSGGTRHPPFPFLFARPPKTNGGFPKELMPASTLRRKLTCTISNGFHTSGSRSRVKIPLNQHNFIKRPNPYLLHWPDICFVKYIVRMPEVNILFYWVEVSFPFSFPISKYFLLHLILALMSPCLCSQMHRTSPSTWARLQWGS